jgi:hypothetical protein
MKYVSRFFNPKLALTTYSGVFWFLLPVYPHQVEPRVCGAEKAALGQSMRKVWD